MPNRLPRWRVMVVLAGAGLALAPLSVLSAGRDIRGLDARALARDLDAELLPISQHGNAVYPIDDLAEEIYGALTDDDHEGDPDALDGDELEADMEQHGTTLESVIEEGLEQADRETSVQQPPAWTTAWTTVRVKLSPDMPSPRPLTFTASPVAQRAPNGNASARQSALDVRNRFVAKHTGR